jgi:NAD(P)H dehydrogenase (quinone)
MNKKILILYYSHGGSTNSLANEIALGVESSGCESIVRTVPKINSSSYTVENNDLETGPPFVTKQDLIEADGLVLGSPTRFGNMAAPLKYFLDGTSDLWLNRSLEGKPFALFTSTSSMHGGQEMTLFTMAVPLLHHGMIWLGCPGIPELKSTRTGGGSYGATHVDTEWNTSLSTEEKIIAQTLGKRIGKIATLLS